MLNIICVIFCFVNVILGFSHVYVNNQMFNLTNDAYTGLKDKYSDNENTKSIIKYTETIPFTVYSNNPFSHEGLLTKSNYTNNNYLDNNQVSTVSSLLNTEDYILDKKITQTNLYSFLNIHPTTDQSIISDEEEYFDDEQKHTYTDKNNQKITEPSIYIKNVKPFNVSTQDYYISTKAPFVIKISPTIKTVYSDKSKVPIVYLSTYSSDSSKKHKKRKNNKKQKNRKKKKKKKVKEHHIIHHNMPTPTKPSYSRFPVLEVMEDTFESMYNYFENAFTEDVHIPLDYDHESQSNYKRKKKKRRKEPLEDYYQYNELEPLQRNVPTKSKSNIVIIKNNRKKKSKPTIKNHKKRTVTMPSINISTGIEIKELNSPLSLLELENEQTTLAQELVLSQPTSSSVNATESNLRGTTILVKSNSIRKHFIPHSKTKNKNSSYKNNENDSDEFESEEDEEEFEDDFDLNLSFESEDYDKNNIDNQIKIYNNKYSESDSSEYHESGENYNNDGFFDNLFYALRRFLPSFAKYKNDEDFSPTEDEGTGRSTTPKIILRKTKPTHSFDESTNKYTHNNVVQQMGENDWDDDEREEDIPTTEMPEVPVWFESWFEEDVSAPMKDHNDWWSGWWDDDMKSTRPPKITGTTTTLPASGNSEFSFANFLQKPETMVAILAQYLKTKATTEENLYNMHKKLYENYQLWRVNPKNIEDVKFLKEFRNSDEGVELQWWKGPTLRGPTDVLVSPKMANIFKEQLDDEDIKFEVVIHNLQKAILYENPRMSKREKIETELLQGHPLTWFRYHNFDDINKFLEYLHRKFPSNVELIHIGRSFEGRPLVIGKIFVQESKSNETKVLNGKKNKQKQKKIIKKNAVFIEAGAHGREWISPAVATWILNTLVNELQNNSTKQSTIWSVDWYIMPILNPDGYEYSYNYDRMWRKTRSIHKESENVGILSSGFSWFQSQDSRLNEENCIGVDLNGNWDDSLSDDSELQSKCNDYYVGPRKLSEPENRALSKFLMKNRKYIKIYLSFHSYGQIISFPKNSTIDFEKVDDILDMALVAVKALKGSDSSNRYTIDNNNEMLYTYSGTSNHFALYKAGIKYSYTFELCDTGVHGYLLPPSYIERTSRDVLEIIKAMVDFL